MLEPVIPARIKREARAKPLKLAWPATLPQSRTPDTWKRVDCAAWC
jgi:hypothetical protein